MPLPNKKNNGGGLPDLTSSNQTEIKMPSLDSFESVSNDEDFTPLSYEEQLVDMDDDYDEIEEEVVERTEIPQKISIPQPNYENPLDETKDDEDKYINKKKKQIIPIGGKKSLAKAKDFDKRKNKLVIIKILRFIVLIFLLGLFGLGIKNTFFPEQIYTKDEIEEIANLAVGDTGFPIERGRAFAQEFLYYYVNVNKEDPINNQILSFFYNGEEATGPNNLKLNQYTKRDETDTVQKPLSQPILFDEFSPTEYIGVYKFSVLLTDTDGSIVKEDGKNSTYWQSFSVNVYYDKNTDSLAIHKSSPTLIPYYNITNGSNMPEERSLGNGKAKDEMIKPLQSTIYGFLRAYSSVNRLDHKEIDQYIPKNYTQDLISGFNGQVELAGPPESSVRYVVYESNEPNQWKVDVYVDWKDVKNSANGSTYTSRYVMTIDKTSKEVYLVSKFSPYIYLEAEKEDAN